MDFGFIYKQIEEHIFLHKEYKKLICTLQWINHDIIKMSETLRRKCI